MTHQFAWTHQPDERGAIRILAAHLLLEGCEQAVSKGPRIGEDPVQAEGGQLSGWPPAPAACPENCRDENHRESAFRELRALLKKESDDSATPQETRRVAEVLEFLDMDDEARQWWEKAAFKGDEDARDYLAVLDTERESEASPCSGQGREQADQGFVTIVGEVEAATIASCVTAEKGHYGRPGDQRPADPGNLMREIEHFLTHLDPTTGGPRC
ncbi:hypothetical protein ACFVZJ_33190 [Streptomyces sp. NPDC058322]|uniref:hypothetical protein n=1 Tax=Streptomyces sp. NPDC058322 TaxID=3346446 RepID=UPI0036E965D2